MVSSLADVSVHPMNPCWQWKVSISSKVKRRSRRSHFFTKKMWEVGVVVGFAKLKKKRRQQKPLFLNEILTLFASSRQGTFPPPGSLHLSSKSRFHLKLKCSRPCFPTIENIVFLKK